MDDSSLTPQERALARQARDALARIDPRVLEEMRARVKVADAQVRSSRLMWKVPASADWAARTDLLFAVPRPAPDTYPMYDRAVWDRTSPKWLATTKLIKPSDFSGHDIDEARAGSWTSRLMPGLLDLIEDVRRSLLPPNVAPIRDVAFADLIAMARDEKIALHLVPNTSVVRALLKAPDAQHRRTVLDERRDEILSDCDGVLDRCVDERTYAFVPYVREAVAASRAGFHAAAQALAANTLDSIMRTALAHRKPAVTRRRRGEPPPDELVETALVESLVFLPVWAAYEPFWVSAGDEVPTTFARNAVAHAVGDAQFTPTNALQGLMMTVAVVGFINDL